MSALAVADHVVLRLGTRDVLRDVSASFAAGEVVALVGPNGAGKSSLLRVLAGLIKPASGAVLLGGRNLANLSTAEISRHIAYLPQARAIHWPMAVRAIVALGRLPHHIAGTTTAGRDANAIAAALTAMDIASLADRPVLSLSGGEQARVLMARALAQEPQLLVADEPTAGLDLRHQLDLMNCLSARAAVGGTSIVALHDLGLAARFASKVILLADGRIVAQGPAADVLTGTRISAVYGVKLSVTHVDGLPVFVPHRSSARHQDPSDIV